MTTDNGNPQPPNYSMLSTQQLEDMLGRSADWEQAAIRRELDQRYSARIRAEAGSSAEYSGVPPRTENKADNRAEQPYQYQYQQPFPPMAPPRYEAGRQYGHRAPYPPNSWPVSPDAGIRPGRLNGLSITSLLLGIFGLTVIGSIAGLIVGFLALRQIKVNRQAGRGLAIAGIVISALWLLLILAAIWG
jgi:hypothetical protein